MAGSQLLRTPLYAGRLVARAPRGLVRLVSGLVRWTFDLEGEPARMAAVRKSDYLPAAGMLFAAVLGYRRTVVKQPYASWVAWAAGAIACLLMVWVPPTGLYEAAHRGLTSRQRHGVAVGGHAVTRASSRH
ncbi:hypothetical protein E1292_43090 [Nonomuraea deserti]|uniref:Uncharacterized protein n=1 Tax=Nonomuraea deserti TaxID=1848322 RepID=A0A4R4UGP5_9ACTN|nr:hypothetical protein [Nonomuraea deserti]TDC90957.1 hypothetical protein E1292_43090 [Nonomuraea deserti]